MLSGGPPGADETVVAAAASRARNRNGRLACMFAAARILTDEETGRVGEGVGRVIVL